MPFIFQSTQLPEVISITAQSFADNRGSFAELYQAAEFKRNGIQFDFVQDNAPVSKKNVIRGLHYQLPPHAQGKLVAVVEGKIWDVAVDVRKSSSTFGQWVAAELNDDNHEMLFIPPGFAHGFVALEDNTRVLYKMTETYAPESERGIIWNDPDLSIPWPVTGPILSAKDAALPLLKNAQIFE